MEALGLLDPCISSIYPPSFSISVPVKHAMATIHKVVANLPITVDRWFVSKSILSSVSVRVCLLMSPHASSDTSEFVRW